MSMLRTWFCGVLETQTALHIGTGSNLNPTTDAPLLRGADGRPLIPGSSLKGALRSASERLLRALGQRACMVFGDRPSDGCLTTHEKNQKLFFRLKRRDASPEDREEAWRLWDLTKEACQDFGSDEAAQRKILEKELCRACLTWGSIFMAGRVRVPDLRLQDSIRIAPTEIRDGVGMDRDTGTAAERIKFDLEVLAAGMRFDLDLMVDAEADRGVVALAVGELLQGQVPLGGRVTRGLGNVKLLDFTIHEVNLAEPRQLVRYLTGGPDGRTAYRGQAAVDRLASILAPFAQEENHAA